MSGLDVGCNDDRALRAQVQLEPCDQPPCDRMRSRLYMLEQLLCGERKKKKVGDP